MRQPFGSFDPASRRLTVVQRAALCIGFIMSLSMCLLNPTSANAAEPRERLSFNADWRFQKGDPSGAEGRLSYAKIKDWVMATGNEISLVFCAAATITLPCLPPSQYSRAAEVAVLVSQYSVILSSTSSLVGDCSGLAP